MTSLRELDAISDPLLRELAEARASGVVQELHKMTAGQLCFANTETWRVAYEKVLTEPGIGEYRSVSWVKTEDYWADLPGQQSMKLNFQLIDKGLRIERILILGWNLWPPENGLPLRNIRRWIEAQHYRGIATWLVRESDLVAEQDLLRDFGIYGDRATGEQELDSESRTVEFTLRFDRPSVRLAQDRWDRLSLYARPYDELLDRDAVGE